MSAHPGTLPIARKGGFGRPGYWRLFRGTMFGQAWGSIVLWCVCIGLTLAGVLNIDDGAVYLPWQIHGVWPLGAAVGWGLFVTTLIGGWVRVGVAERTDVEPARGWCMLAVALGGYGSLLVAQTTGTAVVLAALLTPALVSVLVFQRSGVARPFPAADAFSRPLRLGLATLALVLVLPYGALHPLRVDGPQGPDSVIAPAGYDGNSEIYAVRVGQPLGFDSDMQIGRFGMTVTGVRVLTSGPAVRTVDVVVSGLTGTPAHLPVALAGKQQLWVTYRVELTRCARAKTTVSGIRIYYRMWGLALSQTVATSAPTELFCQGA